MAEPIIELMGKDITIRKIEEGVGEIADLGTLVKCNLKGYFYDFEGNKRITDVPFEVLGDQYYQVGESDAFPGLELSLRHSKKGSIFHLYCNSRFAFGFLGRACETKENEGDDEKSPSKKSVVSIPPNTSLEYEVTIIDHFPEGTICFDLVSVPKEKELNDIGRIRLLTLQSLIVRKIAGNRWFSFYDYGRAAKAYSKATQLADGYFNGKKANPQTPEEVIEEAKKAELKETNDEKIPLEDNEIVNVYISALNNLAASKLFLKEYAQVKDLCAKVLLFSPYNGKALLRAAHASLKTHEYEECRACLNRILKDDKKFFDDQIMNSAKSVLGKLKQAEAKYKEKTKLMQKKMAETLFSKKQQGESPVATTSPASTDAKETPPIIQKESEERNQVPETKNIEAYNAGPPKLGLNVAILLTTSLCVILLSILIAYYYK